MTEQEIRCIVDGQRSFFLTGNTLDVEFRIQSLQKLKAFILKYESEIHAAIQKIWERVTSRAICAKPA